MSRSRCIHRIRRRRDIDNVQKALLDALQYEGVYLDDSQIVRLSIEKRGSIAAGKTRLRIREVQDEGESS